MPPQAGFFLLLPSLNSPEHSSCGLAGLGLCWPRCQKEVGARVPLPVTVKPTGGETMNVSKVSELIVTTPNEVGTMGRVFKLISEAGVNVSAFCAYVQEDKGVFRLLTDDNTKVESIVSAAGYETRSGEVVCVQVESQVGTGAEIGSALGDAGIDIQHTYATSAVGGESVAVFKTADNDKAVEILS
jgi:hypothetical protein